MKAIIVRMAETALYNFFLMLMPVAAVLDMVFKMDFSDFNGKIRHSIVVLQFAHCFARAGKMEEKWKV